MASSMQYLKGRHPGEDKAPDILAQVTWTLQQVCLLLCQVIICSVMFRSVFCYILTMYT